MIVAFILSLLMGYSFDFREGDLLFQDADCGSFCAAIEKVTHGYKGARLSHVGMVVQEEDGLYVIEAVSAGVVLTPIDSFLQRSLDADGLPKILVGRLNNEYLQLIPTAIKHMKMKLGKPYDAVFDIRNDAYYCSELIYEGFKNANKEEAIFELFPMTFKDPDTNLTFDIWVDYFKDLAIDIPEGELGLNPGGMSRSPYLNIVHVLGKPKGYLE